MNRLNLLTKKECLLCGKTEGLQVHHATPGRHRQVADDLGLMVYLCPLCHAKVHGHNDWLVKVRTYTLKKYIEQFGSDELWERLGVHYET